MTRIRPVRLPRRGETIAVAAGRTWLPWIVTASVARCAACHARILWTETNRGNRAPVDARPLEAGLYSPHHATCPAAARYRARRGRGEFVRDPRA